MKVYPKGSTSKFPCMRPELLDRKIPEIEAALGLLLSDDFTYEAAVARHRDNIAAANIDRRYVPQPGDPTLASF
jgi:hypothetical protein